MPANKNSSSATKSGDSTRAGVVAEKASSSFRMHASSSAERKRMKRWLERKQRRQEDDGEGSVMSIVTSDDDIPRPMDPDDSAYRPTVKGPSRIGTARSYRDVLMSPVHTRRSASGRRDSLSGVESDVDSVKEAERIQRTPSPTPPPSALQPAAEIEERRAHKKTDVLQVVPDRRSASPENASQTDADVKSRSRRNKKKTVKSPAVVMSSDDEGALRDRRGSSGKRRRGSVSGDDRLGSVSGDDRRGSRVVESSLSAKRRRQERRLPSTPPLDSEPELPALLDVIRRSDVAAKKVTSSSWNRDPSPHETNRRLRYPDDSSRRQRAAENLFDFEAEVDSTVDAMVVSEDEVVTDRDEYDITDPFIDDGSVVEYQGNSDDSMLSAHSLKRRRRRGRRGQPSHSGARSPSRRTSSTVLNSRRVAAPVKQVDVLEISSGSEDERPCPPKPLPREDKKVVVKLEPGVDRVPSPTHPKPKPKPKPVVKKVKGLAVGEISSGSEDERPCPPKPLPREDKKVVVKLEPGVDRGPSATHPKPKPKPKPVVKKDKGLAVGDASSTPAAPSSSAREKSSNRSNEPARASIGKGKGKSRALDEDVFVQDPVPLERSPMDDDDLHPEEVDAIRRAMKESMSSVRKQTTVGTPGASSSSSPSTDQRSPITPPSSVPKPPITPPSTKRVRMADLVANSIPPEAPSTPSPASKDTTVYYEDLTTHRRCLALPLKCEVWDPELMDPILKAYYKLLCNLRHGTFISWSDMPGRGFVQFSSWGDWCGEMNGTVALDAVNFDQSGPIRNPSRVSPMDVLLRAVPQTTDRYTFYCDTKPPTVFVGVSSIFVDSSQIVEPSGTAMVQKSIGGRLHGYEHDRLTGFVATASGFPTLHAQIARDTIQFTTRAASKKSDGDDAADVNTKRSIPSGMFKSPTKRVSNSSRRAGELISLAHNDIVPVYDARSFDSVDFKKVLPDLPNHLPLYTGGELPYGSFAMVGYTITVFKSNKSRWTVGFNLLWAVLVGSPED